MSKKCLNCDKEFEQTIGKREKKYCSDSCRAAFSQNGGAKKFVKIPREEYQKLLAQVAENNKPKNDYPLPEQEMTDEVAAKIITIKTAPKPSFISKKAWEAAVQKQISALTNNPI